MQVKEIKNEGLEVKCEMVLPNKEFNEKITNKLQEIAKTIKMPGFRPGKVPLSIVEKKYKPSVLNDVLKNEIERNISNYIRDNKLNLATQPSIENVDYKDEQDVKFFVTFEKMPEISEIDLSSIKVEKPVVKVNDKDLEKRIEEIAKSRATYKKAAKTYKAKNDDKIIVDFTGYLGEKEFEGGSAQDYPIVLGTNSMIPGFEEQLLGSKTDQEFTIDVTFPEDYQKEDLAGKEAKFKITVKEIQKPEKTKIDDEFAKELGANDLEDLQQKVSSSMQKEFEEHSLTYQKMKLFDSLEKKLEFEIPSSLFKQEKDILQKQFINYKSQDEELKNKSEEEIEKKSEKIAERRVRIGLMLADYAKNNSIKVTNQDLNNEIIKQASSNPQRAKEIIDYYQNNNDAIQRLSGPLLEEKAVEHILSNKVNLSEKEYSQDKFFKLLEEIDQVW